MRIPYEDNDISLSSVDHLLADIETVSTSLGTDYAAQIRLLLERAPQWISLKSDSRRGPLLTRFGRMCPITY